jgi:hypothetical protein
MTTSTYIQGRKAAGRGRPQGILLSNNPGTLTEDGFYVPTGYEIGAQVPEGASSADIDQFLILSDDNRAPLDFSIERLEKRERTINGRMRSYHIADKLSIDVSWSMLPSRSFSANPNFATSGLPTIENTKGSRAGYQKAPVTIQLTKTNDTIITIPAVTINQLSGNKIIPSTVQAIYSEDETIVIPEITVVGSSGLLITIPSRTFIQPGVVIGAERIEGVDIDGPTVQYVIPQHQFIQPGKVVGAQRVYGTDPDGVAVTQLSQQYTTDGGAGGAAILDWYENHSGSFWAFLSYDKYTNFGSDDAAYQNLNKYSQVVEVFFSDFSYSVQKRGGSNYDFWDISFTLEEV